MNSNMVRLRKRVIGYKEFGEKVDATDPCYDSDVWCRKDGISIEPGSYECVAWVDDKYGRVWCCGIYLEGKDIDDVETEQIAEIGVDAGLAGFFENKPDYNDAEWSEFCESIREGNAWIKDEGFFTQSGWGDGCYPVNKLVGATFGDFVGLEIVF